MNLSRLKTAYAAEVGGDIGSLPTTLTIVNNSDDKRPGGVTVYNFTVDGDHTYFVGNVVTGSSIWVHNSCDFRAKVLKEWEKRIEPTQMTL